MNEVCSQFAFRWWCALPLFPEQAGAGGAKAFDGCNLIRRDGDLVGAVRFGFGFNF